MSTVQIGDRFERLVVIARARNNKYGRKRWDCRCDCGGIAKSVEGVSLLTGNTRSCGCLKRELLQQRNRDREYKSRKEDLTGQIFGRLRVVELFGFSPGRSKHALWKCRCACGFDHVARGYTLLNGRTRSCGCLARELTKIRHERNRRKKAEANAGGVA